MQGRMIGLRLILALTILGTSLSKVIPDAPAYDENAAYLAETTAGLMEGDIQTGGFRNIMKYDSKRWPNGVMPYVISNQYSSSQRAKITSAMAEMKSQAAVSGRTCIQLVPRSNQRDYIYIHPGGGCSSWVGVSGGQQKVSLGWNCLTKGTIQHELLHAFGFWHEQSRPDRDQYVDIFRNNINSGQAYNFDIKYGSRTLGTPYDYDSVMHYGPYSFSRNRQPTILPKDRSKSIGNRNGMSSNDIRKLRLLYKCGAGSTGPVVTTGPVITSPPITGGSDCTNFRGDSYCQEWAGKGKCTTQSNSQWMKIHCTKACNACPPASCKNSYDTTKCINWAKTGECYKNPTWMSRNCSRACNECQYGK